MSKIQKYQNLKWEEKEFTDSVSLGDFVNSQEWESLNEEIVNQNTGQIKDNQISISEIISDLWVEQNSKDSGTLIISVWKTENIDTENLYTVREILSGNNSSLVIERIDTHIDETDIKANDERSEHLENNKIDTISVDTTITWNHEEEVNSIEDDGLLIAKSFTSIEKNRILPVLTPRNDLFFDYNNKTVTYSNNFGTSWNNYLNNKNSNSSGITVINTYASCMTPWWYKIKHGDSVLAYKQIDNAPDICNIERRFCWKWKLSWTYTQQWCSIRKNYTYEQRNSLNTTETTDNGFKWSTRQNSDGSVTVKNNEIWWDFVFERPNNIYTDYRETDNIRAEGQWIEQTSRPYPDCTAPRWEKVKHWQFIQAFKHANWFSDAPCEAQIRLCSMWELMWTYTESTCKTRDTSFIDRVNGSPSRSTYSKEKIEWIKKQIKNEQDYYENTRKNAPRSTNSDALDKILYILDKNNN